MSPSLGGVVPAIRSERIKIIGVILQSGEFHRMVCQQMGFFGLGITSAGCTAEVDYAAGWNIGCPIDCCGIAA